MIILVAGDEVLLSRFTTLRCDQRYVRLDIAATMCKCSEDALLASAKEQKASGRVFLCTFADEAGSRKSTHVAWMADGGQPEPPRPQEATCDYGACAALVPRKRDRATTKPFAPSLPDQRPSRSAERQEAIFGFLFVCLFVCFFVFICLLVLLVVGPVPRRDRRRRRLESPPRWFRRAATRLLRRKRTPAPAATHWETMPRTWSAS